MRRRVPEKRKRAANRRGSFPIRVRVVGMPEVAAAIEAGQVRGEIHVALSTRGLGADSIELAADEEIVARAPLTFVEDVGTFEGEAILIAKRATLPLLKITADDPRVAELARVLARRLCDDRGRDAARAPGGDLREALEGECPWQEPRDRVNSRAAQRRPRSYRPRGLDARRMPRVHRRRRERAPGKSEVSGSAALAAATRGEFDVLVVRDQDRFSRQHAVDALVAIRDLAKTGVQLWSYAQRQFISVDGDQVVFTVMAARHAVSRSEKDGESIAAGFANGLARAVRRGRHPLAIADESLPSKRRSTRVTRETTRCAPASGGSGTSRSS